MPKKKSFWIPLVVALIVAVALGFVVDDSLGENFAPYVGAVSTVFLVAVTTSYVFATYGLAESAERQIEMAREQPSRGAVEDVLREYGRARIAVVELGQRARSHAQEVLTQPHLIDREHSHYIQYLRQLAEFPPHVMQRIHLLPTSVAQPANTLMLKALGVQAALAALNRAAWAELDCNQIDTGGRTLEGCLARWEEMGWANAEEAPSWDEIMSGAWLASLETSYTELVKAAQPYISRAE